MLFLSIQQLSRKKQNKQTKTKPVSSASQGVAFPQNGFTSTAYFIPSDLTNTGQTMKYIEHSSKKSIARSEISMNLPDVCRHPRISGSWFGERLDCIFRTRCRSCTLKIQKNQQCKNPWLSLANHLLVLLESSEYVLPGGIKPIVCSLKFQELLSKPQLL